MMNKVKKYMSTAEAARELGLSVASIQKMVTIGELAAVRTQGGHRRIFITSIDEYRGTHGYRMSQPCSNMICIMHQGNNLDPMLMQADDSIIVKTMSHPLDLLGMEKVIDVLFIDANNQWLETTPVALIDGLQNNYTVFIYNSEKLPEDSHFREMNTAHLIPTSINYQFISGYLVGRKMLGNSVIKH